MQAAAAVEIEEAKAEEARLRQKLKDKDLANKQLTTEKESVKERLNSVELELSRVQGSLQSSESQSEVLRSQMDGVALERDDLQVRRGEYIPCAVLCSTMMYSVVCAVCGVLIQTLLLLLLLLPSFR
jgi:uncharacterized protein YhaN